MTYIEESVAVTAQATFGRDGAMFEGLLGFVAQLSVVLWSLVILTAVIRFVGIRMYRHGAARTALAETVAPSAAVPAAVAAPVTVPLGAPRNRRAEPLSAAHVPTLAAKSTQA